VKATAASQPIQRRASPSTGKLETFEQWGRSLTRRGVLSYLDISLSGAGLIGGGRISALLEESLGDTAIEDLPIRFATITTEFGTGHEIWLTRGRLVEALKASYALPGIFAPVRLGGRWLVDGALVNPVPVSAARALGARLVIAVNLNADLIGRGLTISSHGSDENDARYRAELAKQPGGIRGLFGAERSLKRQFLGSAGRHRVTRARLAGDPPDVMIGPRIGHVGWFDFHRAEEAIEIGARATQRTLDLVDEAVTALAPAR
jgi:NTE family protein